MFVYYKNSVTNTFNAPDEVEVSLIGFPKLISKYSKGIRVVST